MLVEKVQFVELILLGVGVDECLLGKRNVRVASVSALSSNCSCCGLLKKAKS